MIKSRRSKRSRKRSLRSKRSRKRSRRSKRSRKRSRGSKRSRGKRRRRQQKGGGVCIKTLFPNGKVWSAGTVTGAAGNAHDLAVSRSGADLGGGNYYAYNNHPLLPDPAHSVNYSAAELLSQSGGGLSAFFPGNLVELGTDIGDVVHNTYRGFNANPKITSHEAYIQEDYLSGKHNSVLRK